jgi:hypothetical protein
MLEQFGPPGTWRRGCFLVVGVKDGRTIGYAVASGEELGRESVRLTSPETVVVSGRVVDDEGRAVEGTAVESNHFCPGTEFQSRFMGQRISLCQFVDDDSIHPVTQSCSCPDFPRLLPVMSGEQVGV